jgi:hypothetical protein
VVYIIRVNGLSRDFTLAKYQDLCQALLERSDIYTVLAYLSERPKGTVTVLRHDVDRKIYNSLRIAQLEHDMGIRSSYYFRYPYTFDPDITRQIRDLGHEIGFHYEVLSKTRGNYDKAIQMFESELDALKNTGDIRTICMHGSPLSKYDNRDIWKTYDFRTFGIIGEAYLSMADTDLLYLTDTGRNWNGKHSLRDAMPVPGKILPYLGGTDDLIAWIRSSGENNLYLTTHPERWAISHGDWIAGYVKDFIVNTGKTVLVGIRS